MKSGLINGLLAGCQRWSQNNDVLFVVFALTAMASFYRGYGFSNNSYAIASWLVTYEEGFIKRGLIGSLLQLECLSRMSGISIPKLFFAITNALLVSVHVLVVLVAFRMSVLNKVALLFIPWFLLGPLLRTQAVWIGNIDHLLAIMAIGITYLLIKERFFLASCISIAGVFIHEIVFAIVFPVLCYWFLFQILNGHGDSRKNGNLYQKLVALLLPVLALAFVILYHDMVFSDEAATTYIENMIARQHEDNYNAPSIVNAYTASFSEWFYSQRDDFLNRILAVPLFVFVIIPVLFFQFICYLSSRKKTLDMIFFIAAGLLVLCPLAVLVIAWDIDRIWNLTVWVSFLVIWIWLEKNNNQFFYSRPVVILAFLVTIPAFFMLQVRGNIDWSTCYIIYAPLILWQFIFLAGYFYRGEE